MRGARVPNAEIFLNHAGKDTNATAPQTAEKAGKRQGENNCFRLGASLPFFDFFEKVLDKTSIL